MYKFGLIQNLSAAHSQSYNSLFTRLISTMLMSPGGMSNPSCSCNDFDPHWCVDESGATLLLRLWDQLTPVKEYICMYIYMYMYLQILNEIACLRPI